MRYCIKCGREVSADEYVNEYSLCIDCFIKYRGIFKNKPVFELTTCPKCGRWRIGSEWLDISLFEAIRRVFLDNVNKLVEHNVFVIDMFLSSEPVKLHRDRFRLNAQVSVLISDKINRELETILEYRLIKKPCSKCIAFSSKSHRVCVQVRSENGVISSEARAILEKLLSEPAVSEDVVEINENKYGFDIKFYSLNVAKKFINDFVKNTGAKIIESFKPTKYDSKRGGWRGVYTVSLRIPSLKIGDLAEYKGRVVIVKGIESSRIIAEDLENRLLISIDYNNYWSGLLKRIDNVDYYKKYTVIGFDKSTIYLISDDGELREIYYSRNIGDINNGDTVYIVIHNNKEYLVKK